MADDEYRTKFLDEQARLMKLWDAYEAQEKELSESQLKIQDAFSVVEEKERTISALKELIERKDEEIRDNEIKITTLEKTCNRYEPMIEELKEKYGNEKEKLAKLYAVTEDLDDDFNLAKEAIQTRDAWFMENFGAFERLAEAIDERKKILKGKISKEAKMDQLLDKALPSKDEVIDTFQKIQGVGHSKAVALYDAGFSSLKNLMKASKEELSEVKGFSEKLIDKVIGELKKKEWKKLAEGEGKKSKEQEKIIKDFMKINTVGDKEAEALYDAGFRNIDELKKAKAYQFIEIKGFSASYTNNLCKELKKMK